MKGGRVEEIKTSEIIYKLKVKKMPKQKYDWNQIKMEFMLSKFDEVQPFFQQEYGKDTAKSNQIAKMTKWWWKEKQIYKNQIYADVLKQKWKETAKDIESKMERYEMLWDEILNWMEEQFQQIGEEDEEWKKRKINSNDIMNIWKIKRTEMWLPTNISKTENTNKEERAELNDEEMEALKTLLKKK